MENEKKKERELTKAELKRKEAFEQLNEKMIAEGYTTKTLMIGAVAANIFALLIILPLAIPLVALYFIMGNEFVLLDTFELVLCTGVFLLLVVVHEFIHGIFFSIFAKNGWKSVSFGIIIEYLTPYCTCNQPMKKYQMIICAIMPMLILGLGFGIAAIIWNSTILLIVAIMNLSGGGGDLLIIIKLLQYKTTAKDVLFMDHPYEIGTVVFEK